MIDAPDRFVEGVDEPEPHRVEVVPLVAVEGERVIKVVGVDADRGWGEVEKRCRLGGGFDSGQRECRLGIVSEENEPEENGLFSLLDINAERHFFFLYLVWVHDGGVVHEND